MHSRAACSSSRPQCAAGTSYASSQLQRLGRPASDVHTHFQHPRYLAPRNPSSTAVLWLLPSGSCHVIWYLWLSVRTHGVCGPIAKQFLVFQVDQKGMSILEKCGGFSLFLSAGIKGEMSCSCIIGKCFLCLQPSQRSDTTVCFKLDGLQFTQYHISQGSLSKRRSLFSGQAVHAKPARELDEWKSEELEAQPIQTPLDQVCAQIHSGYISVFSFCISWVFANAPTSDSYVALIWVPEMLLCLNRIFRHPMAQARFQLHMSLRWVHLTFSYSVAWVSAAHT